MGGFGSGPPSGAPGVHTLAILDQLVKDVAELQAVIDAEGLVVFDAKRGSIPHPALRVLRDAQLQLCRIESRLPRPAAETSKLSEFIETR